MQKQNKIKQIKNTKVEIGFRSEAWWTVGSLEYYR